MQMFHKTDMQCRCFIKQTCAAIEFRRGIGKKCSHRHRPGVRMLILAGVQ